MINNSLQKKPAENKPEEIKDFKVYVSQDFVKNRIAQVVGKDKMERFISIIVSAVNSSEELKQSTPVSIMSAALFGVSLNFSPAKELGQFYIVPFWNSKIKSFEAQFIVGYKGYIQLAIRSGEYRKINAIPIKEGELKSYNPFTEDLFLDIVEDHDRREQLPTIGYAGYFEMLNGFRKLIYISKNEAERHALEYSKAYQKDKEKGWSYSFWTKNFDGMGCKTVIRQLLSKWGLLTPELERAYECDMAIINEDGTPHYIDVEDIEDAPARIVGEASKEQNQLEQKQKEDIENEFFAV